MRLTRGEFADLPGEGIALQVAHSVWGADDEIVGHAQEEAVFDDAGAGAEFGRQLPGIGDGPEGAVVNDVAFVGDERRAVLFDPKNGVAAELGEKNPLGFGAEGDYLDRQRMTRAQLR